MAYKTISETCLDYYYYMHVPSYSFGLVGGVKYSDGVNCGLVLFSVTVVLPINMLVAEPLPPPPPGILVWRSSSIPRKL